jgi:sugar lactone lactonase YvrE
MSLDVTPRTFGTAGGGTFTSPPTARILYDLSDTYTGYIGTSNIGDLGTGWTLEDHHVYDPTSGILHRGDGTQEGVRTGLGAIYTIAGGGEDDPDGAPARSAWFMSINGIDVGPDGSIYLADRDNDAIYKVGMDGIVHRLAQGHDWFDVTVAPDGNLYLTEASFGRIWKLTPQGGLTVVAGSFAGFEGDGGPATSAKLDGPNNAVVGRDGSIYIADRNNSRVRRVSPDGLMQTVAGTGTATFNGDSLPALETNMGVNHIDVGDDGSIYVSDVANNRIRRVDPSGIVTTLAGTGSSGTLGDGGPASEAEIVADRIRVVNTKDGGTLIYLSDELNNTIRVIDEKGIINRIAGGGANIATEGLPATSADLQEP